MIVRNNQFAWCVAAGILAPAGCNELTFTPPDAVSPKAKALSTDHGDPPTPPAAEIAQPGVGKHSRNLAGKGLLLTPVRTLFTAEEKTVFEIQIPHAMQLYKALHGRAPQSHDEFMQTIIRENQIRLPELPAGQTYEFDPKQEKLIVR